MNKEVDLSSEIKVEYQDPSSPLVEEEKVLRSDPIEYHARESSDDFYKLLP